MIAMLGLSIAAISNPFGFQVWAQQGQQPVDPAADPAASPLDPAADPAAAQSGENMRQFRVTFDTLKVHVDHDPLPEGEGEWVMDAYVNDKFVTLFDGSISVDNGEKIDFTSNNSVTVSVPNNQSGFIRVGITGYENDIGFDQLPVFQELLDMDTPFPIYVALVQAAVDPFVTFDANDPNGYVAVQYGQNDNFGEGYHVVCSERNVVATDPSGPFESACDYTIQFNIEEVSQ